MDSASRAAQVDVPRWIAAARGGSAEALGQLTERLRRYLLLVANEELNADVRAKVAPSDLVQETLLLAHREFARFQGNSERELRAWLRRILIHQAVHASRQFRPGSKRDLSREQRFTAADDRPSGPFEVAAGGRSPLSEAIQRENDRRLQLALQRLPPHYRQAIALRNLHRQSFDEIGAALGRSADAARKLWVRAVEALRTELASGDESSAC